MIDDILCQRYIYSTLSFSDIVTIQKSLSSEIGDKDIEKSVRVDTPETTRHAIDDCPHNTISTLTPQYLSPAPKQNVPQYDHMFMEELCNEVDDCELSFRSQRLSNEDEDSVPSIVHSPQSASSTSIGTRPCDVAIENVHSVLHRHLHTPLYRWFEVIISLLFVTFCHTPLEFARRISHSSLRKPKRQITTYSNIITGAPI